jgi:hypothetical protein
VNARPSRKPEDESIKASAGHRIESLHQVSDRIRPTLTTSGGVERATTAARKLRVPTSGPPPSLRSGSVVATSTHRRR